MEFKNFGYRLKKAIKNSKYTQKQISEILEINQDTITNYIKEKSMPKIDVLCEICHLIDVPIEWIIYGKEENLSKDELEVINKYKKLNERNKIKTEGYIEGLLKEQMLSTSANTEKEEEKINSA